MPARSAEHICVVIGRTRHKMVQAEIQEAARRGAKLIELRLDFLAKAPDFKRLLDSKPCPLVATVRRPEDGGRWNSSENKRQMLLRQCIVNGFDWVDLETDIADTVPRYKAVKRIVSYHNMNEVPDDLEKIHEQMCKQDADVVKVAVRAQDPRDNLRVLDLLQNPAKPTVALCMGDVGVPSRILAARLGMPFTYAAFNKERGIAPGIPSFDDLLRIYHYEDIDAETQIYGLVGDPVAHSLSPLIHNTALREMGLNAVYVPFRVPRGELARFVKDFDRFPVRGYSVTIPHKEAAAQLAREQDAAVHLTGSANTLVRTGGDSYGEQAIMSAAPGEGPTLVMPTPVRFSAQNTDMQAALDSLLAHLPPKDDGTVSLAGRMALILGAGGVARSLAHGLHREGTIVIVTNRTDEKAVQLAEEVGCRQVDWGAKTSVVCDLLINCTSVGMFPNVDEIPIHEQVLQPNMVVFDTVYNPEATLLIKKARERGAVAITGVDMFIRQAALQFKLFTGREPPLELMRKVVRRALSPIALHEGEEAP